MKHPDPTQTPNPDPAARLRRQHSAEEKVRLLRLHLVEGQAISTICDKHQIHPTLFLKEQAIRPKTPLTLEDAKRITGDFSNYYNTQRLHSAIGYLTPADRLPGRQHEIHTARDKKLETARERRRIARQTILLPPSQTNPQPVPAVA